MTKPCSIPTEKVVERSFINGAIVAFVNPVVTFMSIIYGSDCPSKDESVALVLPVANSEAMSLHFEEISKKT